MIYRIVTVAVYRPKQILFKTMRMTMVGNHLCMIIQCLKHGGGVRGDWHD